MVFSVAVGYIKHPAMTCIARELLCSPCLSRHKVVARTLCSWQPRPPRTRQCQVWARCGPGVPYIHVYGERSCQQDSRASTRQGRAGLLLAVWCDMHSGVSPLLAPAWHTCSLPVWARAEPVAGCPGCASFDLPVQRTAALISLMPRSGSVRWQQQQPQQPQQQLEAAVPVGPLRVCRRPVGPRRRPVGPHRSLAGPAQHPVLGAGQCAGGPHGV